MAVVPLALILNIDPCMRRLFCFQPFRNYLCGRAECHSLLLIPFNWHSTTQLKYSACPVHAAPRGTQRIRETPRKSPSKELFWILKFCHIAVETPQLTASIETSTWNWRAFRNNSCYVAVPGWCNLQFLLVLQDCSWREQYAWILDKVCASPKSITWLFSLHYILSKLTSVLPWVPLFVLLSWCSLFCTFHSLLLTMFVSFFSTF